MEYLNAVAGWASGAWKVLSAVRPEILMASSVVVATAATWAAARLDQMGAFGRFGVWLLVLAGGGALLLAAATFSPVLVDPEALAASQRMQLLPD